MAAQNVVPLRPSRGRADGNILETWIDKMIFVDTRRGKTVWDVLEHIDANGNLLVADVLDGLTFVPAGAIMEVSLSQ